MPQKSEASSRRFPRQPTVNSSRVVSSNGCTRQLPRAQDIASSDSLGLNPLLGVKHDLGKMQKGPRSINAGPLVQWLTILVVKAKTQKYLRRLWKPSDGPLSVFNVCIKVTPFDNLAEAHSLQFVAQNTSVPVPKVYCAFIHKGKTYIVMSKIDGQTVENVWRNRPAASKKEIIRQLRVLFTDLRSISPPEGVGVANVYGGPVFHPRTKAKSFLGPFSTAHDFHRELVTGADLGVVDGGQPQDLSELFHFYRQRSGRSVFTHGNLGGSSIIVRGDDVVGIADWERAGWFPPYWEYVCARNVTRHAFSRDEVDAFLEPMPRELVMEWVSADTNTHLITTNACWCSGNSVRCPSLVMITKIPHLSSCICFTQTLKTFNLNLTLNSHMMTPFPNSNSTASATFQGPRGGTNSKI